MRSHPGWVGGNAGMQANIHSDETINVRLFCSQPRPQIQLTVVTRQLRCALNVGLALTTFLAQQDGARHTVRDVDCVLKHLGLIPPATARILKDP